MYYSFIYPYLYYCIVIWGGTFSVHLEPLKIIQKRAIRVVNKKPYLHHTNPLFFHSEIMKLDDVYKFKICDYLYKNNLTISFNREHSHNTRFRNHLLPVFQRFSSSQRSVNFVGPNIWNNLTPEIKESPSIHILKRRLKKYFTSSYETSL